MEKIVIRQLKLSDIPRAIEVEKAAWQNHCPEDYLFKPEHLMSQIKTFHEGVLGAFAGAILVGFAVTEIVSSLFAESVTTWDEMTDKGYIRGTHCAAGDTMYGVDLSVHPCAPHGVSEQLLHEGSRLAIKLSLKRVILGGRIPSYHKYADKMSAEEYVKTRRSSGRLLDPELQIYTESGLRVIKVLPNYMPDAESMNFGVLLEWRNPFYDISKNFKPLSMFFGWVAKG